MVARLAHVVRSLLLLAVLPLTVILYTSNSATAASYGPAVPFSFTDDAGLGANLDCNGKAGYVKTDSLTLNVMVTLKCGVDIQFANDPDPGDLIGTTSVSLDGATPSGDVETCDHQNEAPAGSDPISGMTVQIHGFGVDCNLENICVIWDWQDTNRFMFDEHYTGEWCGDIPMGNPPGVTDSCPVGMPTSLSWHEVVGTVAYAGYEGHNVDLNFALGGNNSLSNSWQVEARYAIAGGGPVPDVARTPWFNYSTFPGAQTGSTWVGTSWKSRREVKTDNIYPVASGDPVGFWVYASVPGGRPHSTYTYGDNDPSGCHFYIGPKFRDDPTTTLDDPHGLPDGSPIEPGGGDTTPPDMTPTDPPAPADDCNFDISDPGSWLSAGMCAAVGILKLIWDTITDILGFLRDLLANLAGLFIPSPGFLNGEVRDMKDAWGETAPANYLEGFSELTPGAGASGCSGLPLNVDLGGGVTIDENLGAACSGPMANIAALIRIALSAVLCVAGAIACVRFVGSGFGWAPGIGRVDG